jgi:hypothetical protein
MGWESTTQSGGDGDGLIGIRDRAGAVGGELEIVSSPGRGTTVRGTIPEAVTPPRADDALPHRNPDASTPPRTPEERHRRVDARTAPPIPQTAAVGQSVGRSVGAQAIASCGQGVGHPIGVTTACWRDSILAFDSIFRRGETERGLRVRAFGCFSGTLPPGRDSPEPRSDERISEAAATDVERTRRGAGRT